MGQSSLLACACRVWHLIFDVSVRSPEQRIQRWPCRPHFLGHGYRWISSWQDCGEVHAKPEALRFSEVQGTSSPGNLSAARRRLKRDTHPPRGASEPGHGVEDAVAGEGGGRLRRAFANSIGSDLRAHRARPFHISFRGGQAVSSVRLSVVLMLELRSGLSDQSHVSNPTVLTISPIELSDNARAETNAFTYLGELLCQP